MPDTFDYSNETYHYHDDTPERDEEFDLDDEKMMAEERVQFENEMRQDELSNAMKAINNR